jgi:hypothetical protein
MDKYERVDTTQCIQTVADMFYKKSRTCLDPSDPFFLDQFSLAKRFASDRDIKKDLTAINKQRKKLIPQARVKSVLGNLLNEGEWTDRHEKSLIYCANVLANVDPVADTNEYSNEPIDKTEKLCKRSDRIFRSLMAFEYAMNKMDWYAAVSELKDVIRYLPIGHSLMYNNLARIFNDHLAPAEYYQKHAHYKTLPRRIFVEGRAENEKLPIEERLAEDFLQGIINGVNHLVKEARKMGESKEKEFAIWDYTIIVVREACRAVMTERYFEGNIKNEGNKEEEKSKTEINDNNWDFDAFYPNTYYVEEDCIKTKTTPYLGLRIPLDKCCLISRTFDAGKIISSFHDVRRNGFKNNPDSYSCTYLPEANICLATNSLHHQAMASLLRDGYITPTHICELSQFYPYVRSDGAYWIDIKTGRKFQRAFDYRIATVYELLRKKDLALKNYCGPVTLNRLCGSLKINKEIVHKWQREGLPYTYVGENIMFYEDVVRDWMRNYD